MYFYDAPREYLVLNAGDTDLPLAYDGENFNVPAGDTIVQLDPKNPEKFCSGKNSEGEWIPGSLVLRDIPGRRGSPDDIGHSNSLRGSFWSAGDCIKHSLGIPVENTPKDAKPSGPLAARGLTVLPMNPAPDLVNRAREAARAKYDEFMTVWADGVIHYYNAKADNYKGKGMESGAPKKDYFEALKWKKLSSEKAKAQAQELGASLPGQEDEDAELLAFARISAEKVAAQAAGEQKVDRDDLVEVLMKDKEFREAIKKKYAIRKHRVNKPKQMEG